MPITRRDYFKPIQLGGCVLWLDGADPAGTGTAPANGSTLTTWVDKSGAGRTLIVGSGTTTYANSAITLANSYMYVPSAVDLTNFSFFIIAKTNAATNNQTVFGARPNTSSLLTSSDGFGFYMDFQTAIRFFGNNTAGQFINQSIVTSNPNIFSFTSGSTVINGWLNASPVSGATGLATRTTTAQGFAIGAEWSGSAYGNIVSTASIYEIIVYNQALSTPQRQQIEAYLAQKWSLTGSLPQGHPGLTSVLYRGVVNKLTITPYYTQFSPKSIPGASLWLDGADPAGNGVVPANNTTITTWTDKSGQANHVSGTATLTNNAMVFNGTTQAFSNISYVFPYTAYSMFAVYANTTAPAATSYMNAVYGSGGYPMLGVYDVNKYVSARSVAANTGALGGSTAGSASVAWATRIAGTGDEFRIQNATDSNGNVFVTGFYNATLTLYGTGGTSNTLPYTGTGNDCFVAKYTPAGAISWAARIASVTDDRGFAIATDSNGNVFVTGFYTSALTLYNQDGTSTASLAITGSYNAFVAKYTSAGFISWATRIVGVAQGNAIATDSGGNVLVTGQYSGTLTLYGTDATTKTLTNTGGSDCFVAKYTSAGVISWAAKIAGTSEDYGNGIAADTAGNVFVIGSSAFYTLTLSGTDATTKTLTNVGAYDAFVAKYTSAGVISWAVQIATASGEEGFGIATDSSGNVFVTGYYSSALTLYSTDGTTKTLAYEGSSCVFVVKYTSAGIVLWAARISCPAIVTNIGFGIATDSSGNVFVTGYYASTVTVYNQDGSTGPSLTNAGSNDCFIAKYTSAGVVSWATRIASTSYDNGYGLATDSTGNVFVTGYYTSALTLYNTDTTIGATLALTGGYDCFIAKYTSSGYISPVSVSASSNVLVSATYTSSTFSPFISGTPTTTLAGTTLATTGIYIGGPLNYFNGSISEVIIYSTTLSESQRQTIESYLSQKWGLTAALPVNHINTTFPAGSPAALQTYITNIKTNIAYNLFFPGIPTITIPTNTGNITVLTMTWAAPAVIGTAGTVTGYIVYILAGGNLVAGTGIGTGGTQTLGNILTTTFSPMTTNLNYSYYVTAVGPGGTGVASSTSSSAIYYATPTAPTVGTATNTGNLTTLTMTWTAGSGTTTYYTVYVVVGGSTVATLTPGNVLTTTYSPMTTNLAYTFYVTGTNTIAGATSGSSATSGSAIYYATPGAPTVGTATNTGNLTTLTMTWTAASGTVTNYTVYVLANNIQVAGTSIGTGGTQALGNVLTASFSPMTTNVPYTFYVIALNNGIAGAQSTTSSSAIYYIPPVGGSITLAAGLTIVSGSVTITAATNATSYTVYISTTTSYLQSVYQFTTPTTGSAVAFTPSPSLSVNTAYYAVLLPVNVSIPGTYSNSAGITTIPTGGSIVLNAGLTINSGSVTITAATGATGYRVYISTTTSIAQSVFNFATARTGSAVSFATTTNLTGTTTYYAVLIPYNSGGDGSTSFSSGVTTPVVVTGLYTYTSPITFTPAGATGKNGPTLSQCTTTYSSYGTWVSNTAYFNMTTAGYQRWTVPTTGSYTFACAGAGSITGASYTGVVVNFTISLTQSQIITIVVGQCGLGNSTAGSGGSGGTFLFNTTTSNFIAIGGGAGGFKAATTSNNGLGGCGAPGGSGGIAGQGGTCAADGPGGSGAGTNGGNGNGLICFYQTSAALSYTNGATGGGGYSVDISVDGGFGGGGGGSLTSLGGFSASACPYLRSGGGGGYGGGGGGGYVSGFATNCGGSGGSYVSVGTATSISYTTNTGQGYVTVTAPAVTPAATPVPTGGIIVLNTNLTRTSGSVTITAATNATNYTVYISTTTSTAQQVYNFTTSTTGSAVSFTPSPILAVFTVYYAVLLPSNANGNGSTSYSVGVTTPADVAPIGGSIVLNSGLIITSGSVTITAATYATSYTVYISTTTSTAQSVYNFTTATTGSSVAFTPSPSLSPNTAYYAVLVPTNNIGNGTTSFSAGITTIPTGGSIVLNAGLTITTGSVTITAASGATGYTVYISTTTSAAQSVFNFVTAITGSAVSFAVTTNLTGSTTYYAVLVPYNAGGNGTTSFSTGVTTPAAASALYTYTNPINFTPAGATGRSGPTLSQCTTTYSSYGSWVSNTSYFNMTTAGYQLWTVPTTGSYTFVCAGAQGSGTTLGRGRIIQATLSLTQGQILKILVGQSGTVGTTNSTTGGAGGGTFIATNANQPILVAGGGGGSGADGVGTSSIDGVFTQGTDTAGAVTQFGSGGASFTNNSANKTYDNLRTGAISFINGGTGGDGGNVDGYTGGAQGGFGGGGGSCACQTGSGGGAGGYQGGNSVASSGYNTGGGGYCYYGGAYVTTTNVTNVGTNSGQGYVTVTAPAATPVPTGGIIVLNTNLTRTSGSVTITAATNATNYTVYISTTTSTAQSVYNFTTSTTGSAVSFTPSPILAAFTVYYAVLLPSNANGNGSTSYSVGVTSPA